MINYAVCTCALYNEFKNITLFLDFSYVWFFSVIISHALSVLIKRKVS